MNPSSFDCLGSTAGALEVMTVSGVSTPSPIRSPSQTFCSVNSVNSVYSVNSYSAVLPPSPMVFFKQRTTWLWKFNCNEAVLKTILKKWNGTMEHSTDHFNLV